MTNDYLSGCRGEETSTIQWSEPSSESSLVTIVRPRLVLLSFVRPQHIRPQ